MTAAAAVVFLALVPAAEAKRPSANCAKVDAKHPHGIAKSVKAAKSADGLTGTPFISAKLYALEKGLDRDKDGVACET